MNKEKWKWKVNKKVRIDWKDLKKNKWRKNKQIKNGKNKTIKKIKKQMSEYLCAITKNHATTTAKPRQKIGRLLGWSGPAACLWDCFKPSIAHWIARKQLREKYSKYVHDNEPQWNWTQKIWFGSTLDFGPHKETMTGISSLRTKCPSTQSGTF